MNARVDSLHTAVLVGGIAVSAALLGLGFFFIVTDRSPSAQSQKWGATAASGGETNSGYSAKASNCAICGTVESIRTVEVRAEADSIKSGEFPDSPPSGRAGQGSGKNTMTILGAAGGFFSGSSDAESDARKRNAYRVTVRMDDGSYRTLSLSSPPTFTVGDKVRVIEGKLVRA